jgi:dihydroorotate dehydrogenase
LELTRFLPGMVRLIGCERPPSLAAVDLMGLKFPGPVGLAAGMDKDAKHIEALSRIGFGFIEIGTVTPLPQPGNEPPRLFRLKADRALINRMGFNNGGVVAAAERLKERKPGMILGGNIGKNKMTPNSDALKDYVVCFKALYPVVDYFVVNVSSPNTPGLRELQEKGPLLEILRELSRLNFELATTSTHATRPILLKIAPDLSDEQLEDVCSVVKESGIAGIVATNTTISREGLRTPAPILGSIGAGGLSGAPVRERNTAVIRFLRDRLPRPIVIIGVGGIDSAVAAIEKFEAGADLVQVYTGLVYEGPSLLKRINNAFIQWRKST